MQYERWEGQIIFLHIDVAESGFCRQTTAIHSVTLSIKMELSDAMQ